MAEDRFRLARLKAVEVVDQQIGSLSQILSSACDPFVRILILKIVHFLDRALIEISDFQFEGFARPLAKCR